MRVQVCIPHYFKEHQDPKENPNGYGSLLSGSRLVRSIALSRCISGLLNLQRYQDICTLNHYNQRIDHYQRKINPLSIEINICTDQENFLGEVINSFYGLVNHIKFEVFNPRQIPLKTRDHLIRSFEQMDLACYMEDDLIIADSLFFDKQNWFLERTEHKLCLMPHRFERIGRDNMECILVDGQLNTNLVNAYQKPQANIGGGLFLGKEHVSFDRASNPHSGLFVASKKQIESLKDQELPVEGFVGPLETAATLTVMKFYNIIKPSIENWDFLKIEHGHPSFVNYINHLPHHTLNIL